MPPINFPKKTLLTVKVDVNTKREISERATELGISTTAFVNLIIGQALKSQRIVLETAIPPKVGPKIGKIIEQAEEDLAADRNIACYKTVKEALNHLDKMVG